MNSRQHSGPQAQAGEEAAAVGEQPAEQPARGVRVVQAEVGGLRRREALPAGRRAAGSLAPEVAGWG
ncbi:MAG: hypothetical protein KUG77_29810, partial [Nannocystaceae bacterium]|nr:hypothetical protein [Nannocystaceae bacterium]